MNILIFLPSSNLAIDVISQILYLRDNGYQVYFLSTSPIGKIHEYLNSEEIECSSLNIKKLSSKNYLFAVMSLYKIVKRIKIDYIISNNLQGNFIAVLSSILHKKRTLLTRHHSDYIFNGKNKNAKKQQWFINRFGKEFIAISDKVKEQMIKENISPKKIHRINLGFDFSLFPSINMDKVSQLKREFNDFRILIVIARLIPLKRHRYLFDAIQILLIKKLKVKLLVIGDGPLRDELQQWVSDNNLEESIIFTGYILDTQNYIAASDLLIHISESEASSHVAREACFYYKPFLACENVGDYEEYLELEKDFYAIKIFASVIELSNRIIALISDLEITNKSTKSAKEKTISNFNINEIIKDYIKLLS